MCRKNGNVMVLLLAISLALTVQTAAQAPNTITYQGRLTTAGGDPIASEVSVVFSIYATDVAGSALFTSTIPVTPDSSGIFTVELGPFTDNVFDGNKRYLGIKVGADPEMTPRQILTSAPYAFNATNIPDNSVTSAEIAANAVTNTEVADNAISTTKIVDNAVTSAKIVNGGIVNSDIADNAVTAAKIADEPGIAFRETLPANTFNSFPAGTTALDSISIAVPGPGYIYVWAHTDICIEHTLGTRDEIYLQVSLTRASITYANYGFTQVAVPAELPTQALRYYMFSCDAHRPFPVAGAGTYKFYLNGSIAYGAGDGDSYYNLQLTAFYFPTAYGTVDKMGPQAPENNAGSLTGENR